MAVVALKPMTSWLALYLSLILMALHVSKAADTDKAHCEDIVPGVTKMFRGVDISDFDMMPLDGFNQKFKSPVLRYTCKQNDKWTGLYSRPDQMHSVTSVPTSASEVMVETMKTSKDVRKEMNTQVTVGGSYLFFSFSASTSYRKMEKSVTKDEKTVQNAYSFQTSHDAQLKPDVQLDTNAQYFLDNMIKGDYSNSSDAYNEFIRLYGTHYFEEAKFGGKIAVYIETSSNFASTRSETELKVDAKASYNGLINSGSVSFGLTKGNTQSSSSFRKASTTKVKYYGGNANLLMSAGFSKWQKTVDGNPWMYQGKLRPLSKLIKDDTKRVGMETAVRRHVLRPYFHELARSVEYLVDPILEFKSKVDTLMKEMDDRFDFYDDRSIKEDVAYNFLVPQWFYSTKMCFKLPTRNDECVASQHQEEICTSTVRKSSKHRHFFVDATSGGDKKQDCNISWGVVSNKNHPDWFNKVSVCYRYYGTKDTMCKGQGEFCSSGLNAFTEVYKNIEENTIHSDCYISWKLSVPAVAPIWLEEAQLCLNYGSLFYDVTNKWNLPDTCNHGVDYSMDSEICAKSNTWTRYYQDATNARKAGCWMSWNIRPRLVDPIKPLH